VSKRDVRLFLTDIHGAIEKIERYSKGLTLEEFWENELVADAVVRNLEIIGEAARHVPDEFRARFPEADWRRVVGFRNVVIHEYFDVDLDIVWVVITRHMPKLKKVVARMLETLA